MIINELDGSLVRNLPGLNGNDEVWYNPGDNHYFLAGSNHTGGLNFGMADGSVRFIPYNVDINILAAMATMTGGEVATVN